MIRNSKAYLKIIFLLVAALSLYACGSSTSNDGAGQDTTPKRATPIGPDLHGTKWVGRLSDTEGTKYISLTAKVIHDGSHLIIDTSLPETTIGGRLEGEISSSGSLLIFDDFDGEDWTAHFGPVNSNEIKIADHVFVGGHFLYTNTIVLRR